MILGADQLSFVADFIVPIVATDESKVRSSQWRSGMPNQPFGLRALPS
jgi:hypothetical protein